MSQMFELRIKATGEVRDAEGNLVSSTPVETTLYVPEEHLRASGLTDEQITQIKEQNS